jgi:hypothetical protein
MTVDGKTVAMGIPTKVIEGVKASIPLGRAGTAGRSGKRRLSLVLAGIGLHHRTASGG